MLLDDAKWFASAWLRSRTRSPLATPGELREQLENDIGLIRAAITARAWLPTEDDPAPELRCFVGFGLEGNVEIIDEFARVHRWTLGRIRDPVKQQAYRERWARKQQWEVRRHAASGLMEEAMGDSGWRYLFRLPYSQDQFERDLDEALRVEMEAIVIARSEASSSLPTEIVRWMRSEVSPEEIVEKLLSSRSARRAEAVGIFLSQLGVTQNSLAIEIEVHPTSVHNCLYPQKKKPTTRGRPGKVRPKLVAALATHLQQYRRTPAVEADPHIQTF
jgi:hypothetical protein